MVLRFYPPSRTLSMRARARHILTDNQRVLDVVAALEESDFTTIGLLFNASQAFDA